MTKVVDFKKAKEERTPHFVGEMVCLRCEHKWEGRYPMPMKDWYECPECKVCQGVTNTPFGASYEFICTQCDGAHFGFMKETPVSPIVTRCRRCGHKINIDDVFT
jgi:DNA-directed RNA polymerase subunit RPC12/RpoP